MFGLSAIDGLATANVNLNVDASAAVTASISGVVGQASSFGGCIDIDTTLAINAEADGDFFSIFKKSATVSLYSHTWDLYKKCFGAQRRAHARDIPHFAKRDTLSCPSTPPATRQSIASQTIPAAR